MSNRRNEIQVGLFAVIGILLFAMLTLVFGGFKNILSRTYTVTAFFPNAAGTTQGTPVRLLGIAIGRVREIALSPDKTGVVMKLDINSDVEISADAPLSIKQEGFIANIYLEFGAGRKEAALPKNGSAVVEKGTVDTFAFYIERATTTLSQMSVQLTGKVADVTDRLVSLADNLNELTGDKEFRQNVKDLTANASTVAGQLKERLPGLIDNLTSTTKTAQESLDKASELFQTYQTLGKDLGETNALAKEQVVRQGANLDRLSASLVEAADNISRLTRTLNEAAEAVKEGQGTVGKLFVDESLYSNTIELIDRLSTAAEEIKDLAETIKKHPDWIIKGPPRERK